jgi:16S rRNA (adenine1518-N6/adenine1519-N6)-dimethyltransferase
MSRSRLSSLLQFLNQNNLKPKRTLSQNFLVDENIVQKIVSQLKLEQNDLVLEIGSGAGALTEKLCFFPIELICVEKDSSLAELLSFDENHTQSFKIVNQDIMLFDFPLPKDNKKWKVVSNLPYHLTSKILKTLAKKRDFLDFCILMVEKGYADDLIKAKTQKEHDATSFILHHAFEVTNLFPVSKNCFFPKPKIDSAILLLKPKPLKEHDATFVSFLEIFFNQKRKMVQAILKGMFDISLANPHPTIDHLLTLRPEILSAEDAYEIFSVFYEQIKCKVDAKEEKTHQYKMRFEEIDEN